MLVRPSPWGLGAAESGLAAEWFAGWVGAACEQEPELAAEAGDYARRRLRARRQPEQLAVDRATTPTCWSCRARAGGGMSGDAWAWARLAGAAITFGVLVWRLGTGPFVDGIRTVDARALAAAAGLAVLTTVCCAWRWKIVARGLGIDLALPARWPRTTARCSSTSRCPAAWSATSTAGSATVAT